MEPNPEKTKILITADHEIYTYQFHHGTVHLDEYTINAGKTLNIQVYTAFDPEYIMPKDWSVTVWSDQEPVELKHKMGLES